MQSATMMTMIWIICSVIAIGALYLAYSCGRSIERKAKVEKAKAKAKATPKAKAKLESCKHLDYTRAGSNQHKLRKRCNDCGVVFEITDAWRSEHQAVLLSRK